MKRPILLAGCALYVLAGSVWAQSGGAPKPGPEIKKLGFFVGNWTTEGEMKASSFGPGGKFTSVDHNEWFPGNFFVVLHSEGKSPMGPFHSLSVLGYNAEDKLYTYDGFDNMGEHDASKGALTTDTWVFTSESKMHGSVVKGRFTMQQLSPTSYSFKFEMASGNQWNLVMDGKATKTK